MAKYILNYNGSKRRTVNCAVLDENYIANTYTVQFNNGVIKNVSKRRVKDLDHIDEAVLDKLKEVVSSLWDKMVKVGKGVFLKIKGKIADVVSPINTMIAAQEIDGVGFYPSESLAKLAEETGVQPTVVEEDDHESQDDINDINDFWKREIYQYYKNGEVAPANESVRYSRRNRRKIYEAKNEIKLAISGVEATNVDTNKLITELIAQYNAILHGESTLTPICIWGAPGVGKTQIVKQVINIFKKSGVNATLIPICGSTLRKDDFFMPYVGQARGERVASSTIADDTPKRWLPVYNPENAEELGKTVEQLDDIANGGDGSGNGGGGIVFLDEFSRISPDVHNVLMQLVMNRSIGQYNVGSKWMFVAAANRVSDMGRNGARFIWEEAYTARFRHFNFVPSFDAWIKWAESPIEGKDEPHVLPEIVAFLKEHQELWYARAAGNDQVDDPVFSTIYPTPRQWEAISNNIKNLYKSRLDPSIAKLHAIAGIPAPSGEITVRDKSDIIDQFAGVKSAEVYRGWAAFDNLFSEKDAQNVWKSGDKVAVRFNSNSSTISKAIEKIMASCPYEMVIDPNDKNKTRKRYPITDKDIVNITDFILKCIYEMDKKKSTVNVQEINLCKEKLSDILTSFKYNYRLHQDNDNDLMILNHMENIFNDAINNTL